MIQGNSDVNYICQQQVYSWQLFRQIRYKYN